uniref:Uncharacterized protein n=1 Tax=Rhizophora mucronata TaxID=61149 RepID=A0A2P2NBA8_RHIMU
MRSVIKFKFYYFVTMKSIASDLQSASHWYRSSRLTQTFHPLNPDLSPRANCEVSNCLLGPKTLFVCTRDYFERDDTDD